MNKKPITGHTSRNAVRRYGDDRFFNCPFIWGSHEYTGSI